MDQSTCRTSDCGNPVGPKGAKGLCPKHYRISLGPCTVEGCESVISARGMCAKHYSRVRKTGSPDETPSGRMVLPDAPCAFVGCAKLREKLEWCERHYSQQRRTGKMWPVSERRADPGGPCVVCGSQVSGRSKYCSNKCKARYHRHPGGRPDEVQCRVCGELIDTNVKGESGWLRRTDTLHCQTCRRARHTRHRTSLKLVVQNQGNTTCGICGLNVDISLRNPDPLAPEVDHILPWALGGTHEIENLQLSHSRCNRRKQARVDYQPDLTELPDLR